MVLCNDPRVPFDLTEMVNWADIVLPNIEALMLRTYMDELREDSEAHGPEHERMRRYVDAMMAAHEKGQ